MAKLNPLEKALTLLRQPDARLTKLNANNGTAGFYIWPRGDRISDEIARLLLEHSDMQPFDTGLLPGHPQSCRLGNWREWSRP
jgi:hypothetical protein